MTGKVKAQATNKSFVIPLVIEEHPRDYKGYPFITLVEYRKQHCLVIVDNIDDEQLHAYVLDLCGPENVDEAVLIDIAAQWWEGSRGNFPIAIEFARRGMTPSMSKLYRSYSIDNISRIIGPVSKFPIGTVKSEKRRRRKPLPAGIAITDVSLISSSQ